jgi:hypothetical protein
VMVEMLKAGVPVIVPAGCWMADELAEAILTYRDRLFQSTRIVEKLSPAEVDWEAGRAQSYYLWRRDARLLFGGDAGSLESRLPVPSGATHLGVRFRWSDSNRRGRYLDLAVAQSSRAAKPPPIRREVVGVRGAGALVSTLTPLAPESSHLRLTWRNAFGGEMISLEQLEFAFFAADGKALPLGAVGLIAAGIDQSPFLLRDIADNYSHYRQTAEAFSVSWGEWHSPKKVVGLLTQGTSSRMRAAA